MPVDPGSRSLFRRYPSLIGKLPWMPLADLPSPVQRMETLGKRLGATQLWIKRDDLNSSLYGGNKARKFEFIFADVLAMGRKEVLTIGSAGSNHGTATSLFCQRLKLRPVLAVSPQPVLSYVRENLLVDAACGAQFLPASNDVFAYLQAMRRIASARLRGQTPPYFMYFGGSSLVGNYGFVEAGFELAEQIQAGALPMPRYVFTATGSCGTHAGLVVAFKALGLPIEVVGVRIVPKIVTNRTMVAWHINRTAKALHELDSAFPAVRVAASEVRLLEDFFGGQYGRPTADGKAAIRLAAETENIKLDPTYTGKAFAGMLALIRQKPLGDDPALFWLTLNTRPLDKWAGAATPEMLPPPLRKYFTEPLYDPEL